MTRIYGVVSAGRLYLCVLISLETKRTEFRTCSVWPQPRFTYPSVYRITEMQGDIPGLSAVIKVTEK